MMTKIPAGSGSGTGNRSGSSGGLVEYLEKEQVGQWFSRGQVELAGSQVVAEIDANKKNLGREDAKYYQVIFAPSQAELAHIGSDPAKLRAFTRSAMEQYAQNFGKGIESKDLVWFAKLEHSRSFSHGDRSVQLGEQAKGVAKAGDQTHIHVIVSRTENLSAYRAGQQSGQHARKNPYHLSPLTNHRATTKGVVQGGFERNGFSQRTEQAFDQSFGYARQLTESFRFLHGMKHGDAATKAEWQRQATADAQKRALSHELPKTTLTPHLTEKTPEIDFTDDLRAVLGQAFRQQDTQRLGQALASAQAERERQRIADQQKAAEQQKAELALKQAAEALKLAEQEKIAQQQKIEQTPQNRPRISQGFGR